MKDQIEKMAAIIRESRDAAVSINSKIAAHFEGIASRLLFALSLFEQGVMSYQSLDNILQATVADYQMTVEVNQFMYAEKTQLN